jgi:hypothetical protein
LLAALVAGEATGSLAFITGPTILVPKGAALDKILTDPEGVTLFASVNTSGSPITGLQR